MGIWKSCLESLQMIWVEEKNTSNILILSYKTESILSSLKMTLHTASKAKVYEVFIVHLMKQMKKSYNLKVAEKQIEKAK